MGERGWERVCERGGGRGCVREGMCKREGVCEREGGIGCER